MKLNITKLDKETLTYIYKHWDELQDHTECFSEELDLDLFIAKRGKYITIDIFIGDSDV